MKSMIGTMQGTMWRMRRAALCTCLIGMSTALGAVEPAVRRAAAPSGTPIVRGLGTPAVAEGATCRAIPDDAYNGQLDSMTCMDVPGIDAVIDHVKLYLGVRHSFIGDLTVKVVDPSNRVVTVLSRPGMTESADDGSGCCGGSAGLTQSLPVSFDDDAAGPSAEAMGASLRDSQVACRDDGLCSYTPAAGAAAPGALAAFDGANGAGTWKVCVGDSENLESGSVCSAVLAFNRLESDLALMQNFPAGMLASEPYALGIDVVNHGPSAQTNIIVNNVISAGLVYVSDDCGGAANGDGWTWQVGALDVGQQAHCNVTVRMAQIGRCSAVSATAGVAGDIADPQPDNNTAVAREGDENAIADPSIEVSGLAGGGAWTSTSTNFGHVFCAVGRCTDVPTLNAYDGDWWAWFGGVDPITPGDATLPETGTLKQTVAIPDGAATLAFRLRAPSCSGDASDFVALRIDGVERWRADASDGALCGGTGYTLQRVDIADIADGADHVVEFHGEQVAQGGATSFFVDSVELVAPAVCATGERLFEDGFDAAAP